MDDSADGCLFHEGTERAIERLKPLLEGRTNVDGLVACIRAVCQVAYTEGRMDGWAEAKEILDG